MIKTSIFGIICFLMTSCSYLSAHPQVMADLEQECIDIAKDTEKVIEDAVAPTNPVTPVTQ